MRNLLAVAVFLIPAAAVAETVVQDVTVAAAIEAACVVDDDVLEFGRYDPISGESRSATARVILTCPEGARVTIRLDGGENLEGGDRRMAGGRGDFLRYNLYADGNHTQVWGNGTDLGEPVTITFEGSNPYRTVFGRLPGGQNVSPGSYRDTVTITVEVSPPP